MKVFKIKYDLWSYIPKEKFVSNSEKKRYQNTFFVAKKTWETTYSLNIVADITFYLGMNPIKSEYKAITNEQFVKISKDLEKRLNKTSFYSISKIYEIEEVEYEYNDIWSQL